MSPHVYTNLLSLTVATVVLAQQETNYARLYRVSIVQNLPNWLALIKHAVATENAPTANATVIEDGVVKIATPLNV